MRKKTRPPMVEAARPVKRSVGIDVVAGFITLDPLASVDEFRRQVVGLKKEGILELVCTPFGSSAGRRAKSVVPPEPEIKA